MLFKKVGGRERAGKSKSLSHDFSYVPVTVSVSNKVSDDLEGYLDFAKDMIADSFNDLPMREFSQSRAFERETDAENFIKDLIEQKNYQSFYPEDKTHPFWIFTLKGNAAEINELIQARDKKAIRNRILSITDNKGHIVVRPESLETKKRI